MAIAFDAASIEKNNSGANTGITGNTISIASGSPLLLVSVFSNVQLTSLGVTFDSMAATQLVSFNPYGSTYLTLFGLVAPTTGSAIAPIATWDNTTGVKAIHAISYTGVSQASLPSVIHTDTAASSTSFTSSITTDSQSSSWIVMYARNESNTFTAGTGATIRSQVTGDALAWADSNGTVSPSASYSMNLSWTGNANWGNIMLEISPPSASSSTSSQLALLGVG